MADFLVKKFIRNYEDVKNSKVREAYGKLGSVIGIISNAILSAIKIIVGLLFNSISITADGVNNLSDTGSSLVTLIGFILGGKPADKDHPFGHARAEYLAGLVVAFIILMLGVELIKTSFDKIRNPEPLEFSYVMIAVLLISIIIKFWQSNFNGKLADKISSATMKAAALDSRNDVISTIVILISIIFSKITQIQIDGYMGVVVALFILYSGVNILKDILNPLLGELPEGDFLQNIENKLMSYEGILNIHDLVIHNYGPNRYFATVHAEVNAKEDILKSHDLIDNIERDFQEDLDINLVIHLDPIIIDDKEINHLKVLTVKVLSEIDGCLSMHDFRVVNGETHTNIIFDVVVPVEYKKKDDYLIEEIERAFKKENDTYYAVVTIDKNYMSTYINKPFME